MVIRLSEMEENNIIIGLKHLSEGLFLPDEWLAWWKQNEIAAKQFLSPRWFLKIKPKLSQGENGATLISQNAVREYLKSIGHPFTEISINNYHEGWRKQIESISTKCDKEDDITFERKFTKLKTTYPKLFSAIKNHLQKYDVVECNFTTKELSYSRFNDLLTDDVITFFLCVSLLKMEGTFICFSGMEFRGEYIKFGELWLNNDGDELYLKPHKSTVYLHDVGTNFISLVNQSFYKFIEFDLSHFISKDQTGR